MWDLERPIKLLVFCPDPLLDITLILFLPSLHHDGKQQQQQQQQQVNKVRAGRATPPKAKAL